MVAVTEEERAAVQVLARCVQSHVACVLREGKRVASDEPTMDFYPEVVARCVWAVTQSWVAEALVRSLGIAGGLAVVALGQVAVDVPRELSALEGELQIGALVYADAAQQTLVAATAPMLLDAAGQRVFAEDGKVPWLPAELEATRRSRNTDVAAATRVRDAGDMTVLAETMVQRYASRVVAPDGTRRHAGAMAARLVAARALTHVAHTAMRDAEAAVDDEHAQVVGQLLPMLALMNSLDAVIAIADRTTAECAAARGPDWKLGNDARALSGAGQVARTRFAREVSMGGLQREIYRRAVVAAAW